MQKSYSGDLGLDTKPPVGSGLSGRITNDIETNEEWQDSGIRWNCS